MLILLALALSACAKDSAPIDSGVCQGVLPLANDSIAALLAPDVPDAAVIAGERLISGMQAGCGWVIQ